MSEPNDTVPNDVVPDDTASRKDYLLTRITRLKTQQERDLLRLDEEKNKVSDLETTKRNLQKAYEAVKKQFDEATAAYYNCSADVRQLERLTKERVTEVEHYQRELSRLLDAERINADYQAQLDAFRDKCLEAYWRPENREDGSGAMIHQIDGAISLAVAGQALLGDKRGLGKTLTSLIYCDFVEAQRVIVVCPNDLMDNFIREVDMWAPHRSPIRLGGMDKGSRDFLLPVLKDAPQYFLVLNYEAWRRDPQLIKDLVALQADTLISDEAHRAKEITSHTAKGVQGIRFGTNICPNCKDPDVTTFEKMPNQARCENCKHEGFILDFCSIKNVLPMTGTPILNKPQELYPQLRLIDPKNFFSVNNFLSDFCLRSGSGRWVWRHQAESKLMKMIGPRYLARNRETAGVKIPAAQKIDHIITMRELEENYPAQYRAYRQARDYAQIVLDPENGVAMSMPQFITVLLRLRQVITWPAGIILKHRNPETDIEEIIAKLEVYESAKIDKAVELIREINEEGDRVVLFSQFTEPLMELQRRLGDKTAVYKGGMTDWMKNQIQLDFDPKTAPDKPRWDNVMVNYKAGGEGLNLNAASHLIILDREWNPGREDQAEGRVDRIGTTKAAQIHRIHVEGSVDMWMNDLIEQKKDMVGGFETTAALFRDAYEAIRKGKM